MDAALRAVAVAILVLLVVWRAEGMEQKGGQLEDPLETGCPIVAMEEVDVVLEFGGEGGFAFTDKLQLAIRQDLAAALSAAGTPDARYIGIRPSTHLCSAAQSGVSRRLLHVDACTELRLVVFVSDHASVHNVTDAIQSRDFCAVAESTLFVHEGAKVQCVVREVSSAVVPGLSSRHEACAWGLPVEGVFFLGVFTGVAASVLFAALMWLIGHKTCGGKANRLGEKIQSCKKPDRQPELTVKSTLASFTIRRNADVNPPHIPLAEDSPSSRGGRGSTEVAMVDEVGMPPSWEKCYEPMVMSMYFEEILPISTATGKASQRSAAVKTRILHKKYKVQETELAQDSTGTNPVSLISLGSKFLFMIDIRKDKRNPGAFPFASVDHVVMVLPDGVPQMLRLVTLSSSGPGGKGSAGSSWHRVAALWDPALHGSQSLSKVTPDGTSLTLDVTVVFRVFGCNQGMSYVKKVMSVRVRKEGQAQASDVQYTRLPEGAKVPEWAKLYVKGAAVVLKPDENSGGLIVDPTDRT